MNQPTMTQTNISIYTDGSCLGNPGPGGWGAVLMYGEHKKEVHGQIEETTNNRAEMIAVIEAIKVVNRPCNIHIYTDSNYICGTMNNRWKITKNRDLWKSLIVASDNGGHTMRYTWVRGHAGNEHNEKANELAQTAASKAAAKLVQERISDKFNLRERL